MRVFDEDGTLGRKTLSGTTAVVLVATRAQKGRGVFVEVSGLQNGPNVQILALDSAGAGESGSISALTGLSASADSDAYAVVFDRAVTLYSCGEAQFADLSLCEASEARRAEVGTSGLYLVLPAEKTGFSTVPIVRLDFGAFQAGSVGGSGKLYRVDVSAGESGTLRVRAGAGASICLRSSVFAESCLVRSDGDDGGEVVYAVSAGEAGLVLYADVGAGARFVLGEFYASLAENSISVN